MSSGLTTPRKLEQIHWRKGITDGDIRPGFMSELLNVEMDEPARLRTRDGIVVHDISIPTTDPCKFIHINSDPSASRSNGWNLFISKTTAYIYPYGYDINESDAATLALPYEVDLDTVEVIVLGPSVIISSSDPTTGTPNTVVSIVYNRSSGRFSPPSYITSGDDTYGETTTAGGWGIHLYNRVPKLFLSGTTQNTEGNKLARRSALGSLEGSLDTEQENGVGVFVTHRLKDTISNEKLGYTGRAVIKVVAVFVYSDGSISLPSNGVDFTVSMSQADTTFDLGYSVMVHKNIFKSIVGVRLYRRILEGTPVLDNDFQFLMYAPLFDDEIHEQTLKTPSFALGNRDCLTNFSTNSAGLTPEDHSDDYLFTDNEKLNGLRESTKQYPLDPWGDPTAEGDWAQDRLVYNYNFDAPEVNFTAGWFKAKLSSNLLVYMPPHYYQSGTLLSIFGCINGTYGPDDEFDWRFYTRHESSIRLTDRIIIGADGADDIRPNSFDFTEGAMIIGSHLSPNNYWLGTSSADPLTAGPTQKRLFPNTDKEGALDPSLYDYDVVAYRGFFRLGAVDPSNSYCQVKTSGDTWRFFFFSVGSIPSDGLEGFETSFAAYRDKGKKSPIPSLEEEFGGIKATEIARIKPRHIGTAGGRLFVLNMIEDNEEQPSKMMYTQFGNFSTFRKDNYIDYGVRDDGYGVAISTLKSYVIAHHTASTYVFDISGGSDFVWREIAAFKDIGAISSNLTATTPFGVFWCDRNHVWFFNGQQPVPITGEITKTYRSIVDKLERMLYKQDLKQVWLIPNDGSPIHIFDVNANRWHTHQLTEFGENSRLHDSIFVVGSEMFIDFSNRTYLNHRFYKFERNSTEPFTWKVDTGNFDMQAPEVIKKMRRLYCHMVRDEAYNSVDRPLKIEATGSTSGNILINGNLVVNDQQIRISTSVRGYHVRFVITVEGASFWRGSMESLGASYKVKKLK